MRHRMAYAKESICKRHTCKGRGSRHFFSCDGVACAVFVGRGQIVKDILHCLERQTVCIFCCHNGRIRFKCVCQRINTRSAGESFGLVHHIVCVNDRHFRQQFIVCQRIFDICLFVCDDRKGSDFRACSRRSRYCNKICFVAHVREWIDPLSDIHKAHCHIHEIRFGMLIQHPHDLACVHCRAAAQSDNDIRLEQRHLLCAFDRRRKCRVGLNVIETGMLNAEFIQFCFDGLDIAVFIQERVGDDKRFFLMHDRSQLIKCKRHTAFFEIDLFRRSEPKHIFSPLRHTLDIQKMLDTYVFRNRVAAP